MQPSINSQEKIEDNSLHIKRYDKKEKRNNMAKKTVTLLPSTEEILEKLGARIRRARLRRNISTEELAQRAGVSKFTLSSIEKGISTVSIGAYAAVLAVLELDQDLGLIAVDEIGKKRFWDQNLQKRERASKRK